MILTRQQRFLLEMLNILGGATRSQLVAFLRPVFCREKPEVAQLVTDRSLRQMPHCEIPLEQEGELFFLKGKRPEPPLLDAVDVMLSLAGDLSLTFQKGEPPLLLRFQLQESEQKLRLFTVLPWYAEALPRKLHHTERIILVWDGKGEPKAFPVPNKQFLAERGTDGTFRFFTITSHEEEYHAQSRIGRKTDDQP